MSESPSRTASLTYRVIGDVEPLGLCGSAIIDAVAELRRAGIIDETGRLLPADEFLAAHPGSPLAEHLGKLGSTTPPSISPGVTGLSTSLSTTYGRFSWPRALSSPAASPFWRRSGLSPDQLDALYLAGAFGNYIDIDRALEIGLLPPVPRDRIFSIGNGAGQGVQLCLLDQAEMDRCEALPASIEHVELATNPKFMETYIMNMNF